MYYGECTSFQNVAISVTIFSFSKFYKPPKYNAIFFDEFAELLSIICT